MPFGKLLLRYRYEAFKRFYVETLNKVFRFLFR